MPSSSENLNSIPETSSENFIINEPYFEKVFLTKENLQFLAKSDPLYEKEYAFRTPFSYDPLTEITVYNESYPKEETYQPEIEYYSLNSVNPTGEYQILGGFNYNENLDISNNWLSIRLKDQSLKRIYEAGENAWGQPCEFYWLTDTTVLVNGGMMWFPNKNILYII